jgi:hypothetical protein
MIMKTEWNQGATRQRIVGIEGNLPKVLLFFSREELTQEQSIFLDTLFRSDIDVDLLLRQCDQRLILPIAVGHLIDFGRNRFEHRLDGFKETRRVLAAFSMQVFFEMARFHDTCISGTNAQHIFVKGPSLAVQYYATPALRQCRDVDVLIPKTQVSKVVRTALARGFAISSPIYEKVEHRGFEAVDAFVAMNDVVTLRSPSGVFFEIHKTLDRNTGLFDTEMLLKETENLDFFGRTINVLSRELLLCYVVYHSTQHTWARLNWFTDVHAILSHEAFDRAVCLDWARRVGLEDLVAGCIELDEWCSAGAPEGTSLGEAATVLRDLFVENIDGGLDKEKEIILSQHTVGLPKRFHAAEHARRRAIVNHLNRAGFAGGSNS